MPRAFRNCPECETQNHVRRKQCSECEHTFTPKDESTPQQTSSGVKTWYRPVCSCGLTFTFLATKLQAIAMGNKHVHHLNKKREENDPVHKVLEIQEADDSEVVEIIR